jgi:hypothetical protein
MYLQILAQVVLAKDRLGAAETEGKWDVKCRKGVEARVGRDGADDAEWGASGADECKVAVHELRPGRVAIKVVAIDSAIRRRIHMCKLKNHERGIIPGPCKRKVGVKDRFKGTEAPVGTFIPSLRVLLSKHISRIISSS